MRGIKALKRDSVVLRRIQKIEGVGSFTSARAGDVELGKINVVYGENRNGKKHIM